MRRPATIQHGRAVQTCVLLVCATLAALVGACSSKKQERMNQREYAQYRTGGTAIITGQVTMTLADGTVMNGSACQVRLMPITTSTTSYIQGTVMTGGTKDPKPAADALWWLEQADAEGRFKFLAVPAGSYYLTCPVAWRDAGGSTKQRILWAETSVGDGQTVDVSVSR